MEYINFGNHPITQFFLKPFPGPFVYFEFTITIGDFYYLVIFGHHINGGFICIPNWKISCEANDIICCETLYNTEQLNRAGLDWEVAKTIAEHITEYFEKRNYDEVKESGNISLHK